MKKAFLITLGLGVVLLGGVLMMFRGRVDNKNVVGGTNVSVSDGTQVIEIKAKGGYAPRDTVAKANMPTVLKIKTNGTFDCSSALTIPSLSYRKFLAATGEEVITVPPQPAGSTLRGLCSMGMYHFAVQFN